MAVWKSATRIEYTNTGLHTAGKFVTDKTHDLVKVSEPAIVSHRDHGRYNTLRLQVDVVRVLKSVGAG